MIICIHNLNKIKKGEINFYNVSYSSVCSTTINMVLLLKGGICYEKNICCIANFC